MLADELHNLRNRTSSLKIECQEIKGKFDETSVKISESLSKLQLKVEEQVLLSVLAGHFGLKPNYFPILKFLLFRAKNFEPIFSDS